MNILLIDDHFCAREGVACLLKQIFPDLKVFEADNFEDGLAVVRETPLNLVLLDVQLPGKNGLAGLTELKAAFPGLCVVMFSGLDDRELVFEALRLGAMGFIVKTVSRQAFIEALRDVLSGKVYLPPAAVGPRPADQAPPAADSGILAVSDPAGLSLTPREFEVLSWLVQGKCNKQIATQLGIGEQTVRNHLRPIFRKFGVARRAELLVKVFQQGIVFGRPGIGN
ncbi:MAG: response regulator transcription factor [Methylomonas sp.]|nr:response regulator transcription factor [Methylomonas sp.]